VATSVKTTLTRRKCGAPGGPWHDAFDLSVGLGDARALILTQVRVTNGLPCYHLVTSRTDEDGAPMGQAAGFIGLSRADVETLLLGLQRILAHAETHGFPGDAE
jgi:hypothetical protein